MATSKYPSKQLDEYRHVLVDDGSWSRSVQDDFAERMAKIGIGVDQIFYSGFWSQGDGAMFEGWVQDWDKYLRHLGYEDDILIEEAKCWWSQVWEHSGRYYHEHSVSYSDEIFLPENPYIEEDDSLRYAVWQATMDRHDLLALTEEVHEDLRDHMRDLYKQLEKEYDSLTSDEAIIEFLELNDIEPETD